MDGKQKAVYIALYKLATSVGEGKYGRGNDVDAISLEDDIAELVSKYAVG